MEIAGQNFVVYQNNETKNLIFSNPLLLDVTTGNLCDVAGKLIFNKKYFVSNSS